MELRQALIDISNDARGWLKAWARDFTDAEARDSGGTRTHPAAWHLGHLACAEDDVYRLFTGDPSGVPETVRAVSGGGCPAPTPETEYLPVADLWSLLERTHERFLGLTDGKTDEDFDQSPLQESKFFKSLGQSIYELALHENYHVGQVATLRKALGKKPIA